MDIPEQALKAEQQFFEVWRQAVSIAGVRFFGEGTQKGLEASQGKNALRPRLADIEGALSGMSPGEQIFICSMYQLFNTTAGRRLTEMAGIKCDMGDLTRLDVERKAALMALLATYVGW